MDSLMFRWFLSVNGASRRPTLSIKHDSLLRSIRPKDWQVTVSASSSIAGSIGLGRGGSSVGMYIAGPDMEKLTEYANAMVAKMKEVPLYRDPDTSIEIGNPEIRVTIDRTKGGGSWSSSR
jgi:HAE1 family hydrophobic/amphiphilic exporter-1